MNFSDEIAKINTIFIDTAPIIYYIEAHPQFGPLTEEIVDAFQSGALNFVEFPKNPILSQYPLPESHTQNFTLEMPVSYGIGSSIRFSDKTSIALDFYRTHSEDFLLYDQYGKRTSPINNEEKDLAYIKPTIQVRLDLEYFAYNEKISLRTGIFYDPEPASGKVDDFYGVSIGLGFVFEDFTFDMAYQYRFGEKTFYIL